MSGERLPGTPGRDTDRVVFHVDMDCFYAACERKREPALRGEPVVVGMGFEPGETHGAVATASYEAREHGVESAQAISRALELLPRTEDTDEQEDAVGYYRPVDMSYYESVSEDVREVLHEVADTVRETSIDEAYLAIDQLSWEGAEPFARSLKERIQEEAGVPASIGCAPNMSTAKVASDYDKPDGLVVVRPDEVASFLAPLDIEQLHGIGPVTARELREMGIETSGELASAEKETLTERFGGRGGEIHDHARGKDDREVEPVGKPKSLSNESAFTEATTEAAEIHDRLLELADQVTTRAMNRGVLYKTIGIKVVTPPFDVHTRSRSLSGPVDDPELVETIVLDLIEEFEDADSDPIRKLGVRLSRLSFVDEDQASLDEWSGNGTGVNVGDDREHYGREWSVRDRLDRERQTSLSEFV